MNGDVDPPSGMEVRLLFIHLESILWYKDRNNFISLKNTSNIPVGNGSSFKAIIIKPTTILNNIKIIDYNLLFVSSYSII
jgi:hypothetical protein